MQNTNIQDATLTSFYLADQLFRQYFSDPSIIRNTQNAMDLKTQYISEYTESFGKFLVSDDHISYAYKKQSLEQSVNEVLDLFERRAKLYQDENADKTVINNFLSFNSILNFVMLKAQQRLDQMVSFEQSLVSKPKLKM